MSGNLSFWERDRESLSIVQARDLLLMATWIKIHLAQTCFSSWVYVCNKTKVFPSRRVYLSDVYPPSRKDDAIRWVLLFTDFVNPYRIHARKDSDGGAGQRQRRRSSLHQLLGVEHDLAIPSVTIGHRNDDPDAHAHGWCRVQCMPNFPNRRRRRRQRQRLLSAIKTVPKARAITLRCFGVSWNGSTGWHQTAAVHYLPHTPSRARRREGGPPYTHHYVCTQYTKISWFVISSFRSSTLFRL